VRDRVEGRRAECQLGVFVVSGAPRFALERARSARSAPAHIRFVGVSDTLSVAGGRLLLFAIDGVASEVALAGFVRSDGFLWASDYI
jgi:hypothetical protein